MTVIIKIRQKVFYAGSGGMKMLCERRIRQRNGNALREEGKAAERKCSAGGE